MRKFVAPPPAPADGVATPPVPPLPPVALPLTELDALPVAPDCDDDEALEPELAWLVASAVAMAPPVDAGTAPPAGAVPDWALGEASAWADVPDGMVVPVLGPPVVAVEAGGLVVAVVVVDCATAGPAPRNTNRVAMAAPSSVLSSDRPRPPVGSIVTLKLALRLEHRPGPIGTESAHGADEARSLETMFSAGPVAVRGASRPQPLGRPRSAQVGPVAAPQPLGPGV